ncbi:AAA family ATPase [Candidatus Roizmanbacteria bacterium RIFCSPLOWO2_02_FULL_41_9]|uniref:AAA family ATPase n=1 Tax=Candidatus Roizmanbacteria bacterium RIFCSPLOWO2_02_FULL_41_9 TaxID=1802077 RepID=A0A1F7JRE3_9BACT|nr:MAG: AAA family ATPase [Candidatus Roizmanbacteria bacterium RIFCSPLOWO2_02_FULL_41_9]
MSALTYLKQFRLAGMVKSLELRLTEAAGNNLSHREFLDILLEDEKTNREDNRRKKLYGRAKVPVQKHIDEFDFAFQPSIKKQEILNLATCAFIPKGENIVFVGQPGTGKTHLAIALGLKALGYGYVILFTTAHDMITTLQAARADHTYRRKIEYYTKPDLLILDELGYKTLAATTVEDFFEIISKRYEKKSTIITSNKEFPAWDSIFFDKTLTTAIIDRIIHHCHTVIIKGESYRFQNRRKDG